MARHWRKHDPLTFKYARYPHEHAAPADYAKSEEGHIDIDGAGPWYCVATTVAALAICGVVAMLIFERFAT